MYQRIQLTNTVLPLRNSMTPATSGRGFLLIALAVVLAWLALSPTAKAQVQPCYSNCDSNLNTANGGNTLGQNTTGKNNTAIGWSALANNNADNNTATGFQALAGNTTGSNNTANGWEALFSNTTGGDNIAIGDSALFSNTTGNDNVSTGDSALAQNKTGNFNTANGTGALNGNTTGSNNVALGASAGLNLTTGSNNIEIGANVPGTAGEANTIRIGKQGTQKASFIAGIFGAAVSGSSVVVNSSGRLGVASSSARFKEAIKPMDKASETILALKPVTFRYKEEIDPQGIPQFGLIAEEVEKVDPDLVGRDDNGKVNTVRYEAVNAMLLNEFLKEHRKVQEQAATIADLKSTIAQQQKEMAGFVAHFKEQDSKIQKVSAQMELTKPAPQVVLNNQ